MRLEFSREDLVVQIDSQTVSITSGTVSNQFAASSPQELVRILAQSTAAGRWAKRLSRAKYTLIFRICLDIRARELQPLNWEAALLEFVQTLKVRQLTRPPIIIVRVSPVWPRSANFPFTLPLRLIEVNAADREYVRPAISHVFHRKRLEKYEAALLIVHKNWKRWDQFQLPRDWPTVEVLHINKLPPLPDQMLSGDASVRGTLGWFVEKLVTWQVRLLVIHCEPGELDQMRLFASAVLARGGPAVLVEGIKSSSAQRWFYNRFYEQLIHDFPLDAAWQLAFFSRPYATFPASLFVGGGREEQLRPSNIAMRLAELGADKNQALRQSMWRSPNIYKVPAAQDWTIYSNLEEGLKKIHTEWPTSRFEFREREGFLPLSEAMAIWRTKRSGPVPVSKLHRRAAASQPRYVNCSFWQADASNELREVDQQTGYFQPDHLYQLGIQIGPKNRKLITINETALFEEVFKWKPEMKGVWIEVGVTGIDFEVVGDPVQRVWLPAPGNGPTDMVHFSVIPRKAGVNRLRFAIYYEQNVIQSFRVGVITGTRNRGAALAKALEIKRKLGADIAYLPVLEFSLASSVDEFASNPSPSKRTLAIIANNLGGDSVVTVKNASSFGVRTPRFLADEVAKLQKQLLEISNLVPPNPVYPFTLDNEGTPADLESMLRTLADRGAMLFQYLIDSDSREGIRRELEPPDLTIQVAQILREDVIPWSFVYTRMLDPQPGDYDQNGKLTNIPVCLAPLPDAKGNLPVKACGSSPNCALRLNPALQPENVVCPLEFWGFKHVVEIPPKQIDTNPKSQTSGAANPSALQTAIKVKGNARVVAGVNGSIGSESDHFRRLAALKTKFHLAALKQQYTFANLRAEFANSPFHIAYFFCHAEGGANVDTRIVLQDPLNNAPEFVPFLKFSNLYKGKKWDPPALVFLNACESNNYSAEALSPFLDTFVDTLGASGVIGTEVKVWDIFAAEIGRLFLENFLNGETAGMSLLKARRALLFKNNPLGLVYTLFAPADLHLE